MDQSDIDKEVFDILNTAKPIKIDDRHPFRTALIALSILIVAGSAFAMYSVLTAPRGEIVSPAPGTLTSRVVEIEGYTKNIPLGRRYIWTTVDVKSVDQSYHNDILKWFEDVKRTGSAEGFTMMPASFKLDSVILTLEGV